ncbi:MAG: alanine--glyoxylate aminotransferase family protein [Bdellovibrionales bacterium]|nr:alanine--glyoxylate aminotransferase family protein [Bdellovibrionales bacterium]
MKDIRLFTPGPTPVPERIRKAGAQMMIHHRSLEFENILQALRAKLKLLYGTKGEVVALCSSGTGGLEASMVSLFNKGDEVVVIEAGKFGQRLEQICKAYEFNVTTIHVPWGQAVTSDDVIAQITPRTRAICIQACESSTGAFHPIYEIGKKLKEFPNIIFMVDAITALGVHDLNMDRDGIDVLVGASQKAFMCPPGLATVGLSLKAIDCLKKDHAGYYFSLAKELAAQRKNTTAYTPAISLCVQLLEALKIMEEEGFANIFKRHLLMRNMTRSAFRALDLELFNTEADASNGITVVTAPGDLNVKGWLKTLKNEEGLWLAGGQDILEEKIFRMAHMGAIQPDDVVGAIYTVESSLSSVLPKASTHEGSKAAKKMWCESQ